MVSRGLAAALLAGTLCSAAAYARPVVSVSPGTGESSSVQLSSTTVSISSPTWRSVPNTAFGPGEDLLFVISWGVITGGYSLLSVHGIETVNGRPSYHLVEDANSAGLVDTFYHVHDRNDSWVD